MNPCHTTSTGISIGRAYVPPPQRVQGDAIQIQRAMLAKEKRFSVDVVIYFVAFVGWVVWMLSTFVWGKP